MASDQDLASLVSINVRAAGSARPPPYPRSPPVPALLSTSSSWKLKSSMPGHRATWGKNPASACSYQHSQQSAAGAEAAQPKESSPNCRPLRAWCSAEHLPVDLWAQIIQLSTLQAQAGLRYGSTPWGPSKLCLEDLAWLLRVRPLLPPGLHRLCSY